MATLITFDAYTCVYLLLFGLMLLAALCVRGGGHSPTSVDVRGVGSWSARLSRIEERLPQGLTGHDFGRPHLKGLHASVLDVYPRQSEEAIKRAQFSTTGPAEAGGQKTLPSTPRQLTGVRYS